MALLNSLKQFNWVDILFVIVLIRVIYVAAKNTFPAELFRLLGTVLAAYLALHYYTNLSDYAGNIVAKNISKEYLVLFSFLSLVIVGYLIFALLGKVVSRFFKMEAAPRLNRWGSFILGIARSFLLISLIIFILLIAPGEYLKHSVNNSYSGKRLFKIAPATYTWLWENIVSKFRTQEKFNNAVLQVEARLTQK